MEGRDISVYQGVQPPEWFAQWDFVIIRAFDDQGRPDAAFRGNWSNAVGRTRRGAYGWPCAGADNAALAAALVAAAPGAEFGYWADYESVAGHIAAVGDLETYVAELVALTGKGGFYSNLAELPRTPLLDATPWWFANPSANPDPRPVAITQYGIVDGVDANTAAADPFPPPPPPTPSEDDVQVHSSVVDTKGNEHLFVLGNDRALYTKVIHGDGSVDPPWPDWLNLGGAWSSLPVATLHKDAAGNGVIVVTGRGTDRAMYFRRFFDDGGGWENGPRALAGQVIDPS